MGSLGSQSVNEKMLEILNEMKSKDYNVIYVTGKNNYDEFASKIESTDNVKIVPYIDQFNVAGNSDLVISRGGATSACEYMALGLPSIIIPSPYVPYNHQFINAEAMANNGASIIVEEKDMSKDLIINIVDDLFSNPEKLEKMSVASKEMSHPNAAIDIANLMYEMVGRK